MGRSQLRRDGPLTAPDAPAKRGRLGDGDAVIECGNTVASKSEIRHNCVAVVAHDPERY